MSDPGGDEWDDFFNSDEEFFEDGEESDKDFYSRRLEVIEEAVRKIQWGEN
ncbi:MAG: hypothetical protein RLZZ602_1331 [Pseudomonadota bacterium]|jgi:broad specificity phosphatase PhoE